MARAAWFHCFSGIAGDMALGALLDAGADEDAIRKALGALAVTGWELDVSRVQRGGVRSTRATVTTADTTVHRVVGEIVQIISDADLPDRVAQRAIAVFRRLADVEGLLHGMPADAVELHEVGSIDAIVDIVGTCAALESLGIDEIRASAVAQGTGNDRAARRRANLRPRSARRADDTDGRGDPRRVGRRVRRAAGNDGQLGRLRRRPS